jgi:hypothetical protein
MADYAFVSREMLLGPGRSGDVICYVLGYDGMLVSPLFFNFFILYFYYLFIV